MKFSFLEIILLFMLIFSSAIASATENQFPDQLLEQKINTLQRHLDVLDVKFEATKSNLELRYETISKGNDNLFIKVNNIYRNVLFFSFAIIGIAITLGTSIAYRLISKNIQKKIEEETENERRTISAKIFQELGNNCEGFYKDIDSTKHPLLHMSYVEVVNTTPNPQLFAEYLKQQEFS
jgi:hypothetical protein